MKSVVACLNKNLLFLSAGFAVWLFCASSVNAATVTWDGGGSTNNMTEAANWAGDVAPVADDDLVFPLNVTKFTVTNDFTAGTNFNSLTFNNTAGSSSYTISGNAFTLGAGGITSSSGDNNTISANVTLSASSPIAATNSGVTIGGSLALGAFNLTVSSTSPASVSIGGVVTGSASITKNGTGAMYMYGNSPAYAGNIILNGGFLEAQPNSLGTTAGNVQVNNGADLDVGTCSAFTLAENITLTGASSVSTGPGLRAKLSIGSIPCAAPPFDETYGVILGQSDVTYSGNLTLGSNVTFGTRGKKLTLTGQITGAYGVSTLGTYPGEIVNNTTVNQSNLPAGSNLPLTSPTTLSNNLPTTTVAIYGGAVVSITGTRGVVSVSEMGVFKGHWDDRSAKLQRRSGCPRLKPRLLEQRKRQLNRWRVRG